MEGFKGAIRPLYYSRDNEPLINGRFSFSLSLSLASPRFFKFPAGTPSPFNRPMRTSILAQRKRCCRIVDANDNGGEGGREWVSDDYRNVATLTTTRISRGYKARGLFIPLPRFPSPLSARAALICSERVAANNGRITMACLPWIEILVNFVHAHPFDLSPRYIRVLRARWLGRSTIFQDSLRDKGIFFYFSYTLSSLFRILPFLGDENFE